MKSKQRIGAFGEEYAASVLQRHGYEILARNFTSRYGELDIVAAKDGIIAFVEVKSRSFDSLGTPAQAVGPAKQRKLILTAQYFLLLQNVDLQPRFDVFEVVLRKSELMAVLSYNHICGAFELNEQNTALHL